MNQAVSEKELNKIGQNEILIKWKYADNQPVEISGVGMAVPNTLYVVLDEEKDWLICYVNDIHVVLYLKQYEVDELLNCLQHLITDQKTVTTINSDSSFLISVK